MEGAYQNSITDLPLLDSGRYENIFKIYNVEDTPNNFYFYNITRAVKINKDNIDQTYIDVYQIDRDMPWTTLAYRLYGSIYLWWLIKILNPTSGVFIVKAGTTLTVIKPSYVKPVLDSIATQIKQ